MTVSFFMKDNNFWKYYEIITLCFNKNQDVTDQKLKKRRFDGVPTYFIYHTISVLINDNLICFSVTFFVLTYQKHYHQNKSSQVCGKEGDK